MIINDNIANQLGDVIEFKTVPLFNITQLLSYTDSITGTTAGRFFGKKFCYTFDGVVYTEYTDLTNENLKAVNAYLPDNPFVVLKFRYERQGGDNTGQLVINSVTVNGVYNHVPPNFQTSKQTPFAQLVYDNVDVWNIAMNLAQKMYEEGIIPVYLTRGEEADNIFIDKDYIDFWEVVAKLFGLILVDSYKFTVIYWRKELLAEYLKQRGICIRDNEDIVTLQQIAKHFFDEVRQRGTAQIFKPKGYEYPTGRRYVYESPYPDSETLRPSLPVWIDGVQYREVEELPDGWVWLTGNTVENEHGLLLAPDANYHSVEFNDANGTRINYLSKALLQASITTGITKDYDGEYLRLINYKVGDEFMYNLPERKHTGWCLGNSSPMYKGLGPQQNKNLIKVYDTWQ